MQESANKECKPPKWAMRFLAWFCPASLHEMIEGDLLEQFELDATEVGCRQAKREFVWNVISFIREDILIRNSSRAETSSILLLNNYLKITWRQIARNKVDFAFKLGGLTLALFSFLVISLYVTYQLSFDQYHDGYENIYRVNSIRHEDGGTQKFPNVPSALGPALKANFRQVKSFTRIGSLENQQVKYKEKMVRRYGFVDADNSIFDVFTFKFIYGNDHALDNPESIVLTKSLANQIFGEENPINKPLSFTDQSSKVLNVTGVIDDLPTNTHLDITAIVSYDALTDSAELSKGSWNRGTGLYIRLKDHSSFDDFSELVSPILRNNLPKKEDGSEKKFSAFLQPIKDIYLADPLKMEFCKKGSPIYVYIFSLLGLFLLIIAAINHVNLSIAGFNKRLKELGVRKIFGARKRQIAFQVATEAIFYCILAVIISVVSLYYIFPEIQRVIEPNLKFSMLLSRNVILLLIVTTMVLLLFSISYPTILLSSTNPINTLKGIGGYGANSTWGRRLLAVQFVVAVICICAAQIVSRQASFIRGTDLGYDRHNVISLLMPDKYPFERAPVLKAALQNLSGVESVSYSYYMISGSPYWNSKYKVEMDNREMKEVALNEIFIDRDFLPTMGIALLKGRNFNANKFEFKTSFLVNESAVKEFNWSEPIGKRISFGSGEIGDEKWEGTVVGVTKDFNIRPLRERIEPLIMRLQWDYWPGYWLNIKINGKANDNLASIKSVYEKILPGYVIDYRFMEDIYENQYKNENKANVMLQVGTWIIVLISLVGVFSLVAYSTVRRTKEFGIRKVVGASTTNILAMISKEYLVLIGLSIVIGLPIVYILISKWLNDFVYHMQLQWWMFAMPILLLMALTLLIVNGQSLKAAASNPAESLKYE